MKEGKNVMSIKIQPVLFRGLVWGSPGKAGGAKRRQLNPAEIVKPYRENLPDCEVADPVFVDSPDEAQDLRARFPGADLLLVTRPELLSCRWAAPALVNSGLPLVLHNWKNNPSAVLSDLYGYLHADNADATLALDYPDIARRARVVEAHKRLRNATLLCVGDGFPSWSQVANPTSPEQVTERFGLEVVVRDLDELIDAARNVAQDRAEALVQEWRDQAAVVTEAAEQGLVEAAQAHLALEAMVKEASADAVTVDCRKMDEDTMARYGSFLSPCMSLTVLRDRGIPAACEADICVTLAMMILEFLAKKPTFMGNLNTISPEDGHVGVAHCAATTKMDGYEAEPAPLELSDYHHRGTGVASYSQMREGIEVTIARVDKNLANISVLSGTVVDATRGQGCINRILVQCDDVADFVERCMVGDHYAAVYGNIVREARALCRGFGVGVLEPGNLRTD